MLQPPEALHDPENPQQVMEASVHQARGLLFFQKLQKSKGTSVVRPLLKIQAYLE